MADWTKVMFCDENTSRLVLRGYKLVRRPSGVSRYDSRYHHHDCEIPQERHGERCFQWG